MMDRLVTLVGGGGFLGRYVAQALLKAGARVRIAQRDPRTAFDIKPLGGLGQTQFVVVDVRKPESIARAFIGSDAVVDLVGILKGDFQAIHVDGARHVAEAARAAGVAALVHVSAIGADPAASSAYARTKGQGEEAVRTAFASATVLRPSIVFGREDQFTNRFASMIAGAPIVPVVKAATRFQPVYVGDVAATIAGVLGGDDHEGKTYELGGADVIAMGELLRWIAGVIGRSPTFIDVPDGAAAAMARLGFLPGAPITWDQWLMLQHNNVVAPDAEGLAAFGITPTPLATVAPNWLVQYRRHGRFGTPVAA